MLRQEAISRDDYGRLNGLLAESLPKIGDEPEKDVAHDDNEKMDTESNEEGDDVDPLTKIINSTLEYVNQYDEKELKGLLEELKEDRDHLDTILELEELIEVFLGGQFLENEPILPKLNKLTR